MYGGGGSKMQGAGEGFDEDLVCRYVEILVDADEVERALLVLDNLPAYYRDNPPLRLQKLRQDILAAMVTAHAYMSCDLDAEVKPDQSLLILNHLLRGKLIDLEVGRYNAQRLEPHIVDLGPGEYFVPIGLSQKDREFTYWDIAMDRNTQKAAHPIIEKHRLKKAPSDRPLIFLALEVIEHLAAPRELAVEAIRHCGRWPDRVQLSTPQYTFDSRKGKSWRKSCGLPHLRAYTPNEFIKEAQSIFPGYQWQFFASELMSLRGMREDRIDTEPVVIQS